MRKAEFYEENKVVCSQLIALSFFAGESHVLLKIIILLTPSYVVHCRNVNYCFSIVICMDGSLYKFCFSLEGNSFRDSYDQFLEVGDDEI